MTACSNGGARTDRGGAGDKVPAPDHATAPLPADAESGGVRTDPEAAEIDAARRRAIGRRVAEQEVAGARRLMQGGGRGSGRFLWFLLAMGAALGAALAVLGLAY